MSTPPSAPSRRRLLIAVLLVVAVASVGQAGSELRAALRQPPLVVGDEDARGFALLYRHAEGGAPVRWNPCEEIPYAINPDGAPAGGVELVHEAVRRTATVTGLRFRFDGFTDEVDHDGERPLVRAGPDGAPAWAPVLVGWRSMDGDVAEAAGYAISIAQPNRAGRWVFVSGVVWLDRDRTPLRGFGRHSQGLVALHEVGHIVGLDHVSDPRQVMYADTTQSSGTWGSGDLAGLEVLGAGAGCLVPPDPADGEVWFPNAVAAGPNPRVGPQRPLR